MVSKRILKVSAVALAGAGLLLPQNGLLAAEARSAAEAAAARTSAEAVSPMMDLALGQGGSLQGVVFDGQGQPVANAPLSVLHDGKVVASTTTSEDGAFAIRGLRSGVHQIHSGEYGGICRIWNEGTAPPSALQKVMIVRGTVVRGSGPLSFLQPHFTLFKLCLLAGVVAGGVISQSTHNGNSNGHGYGS